VPCWRSNPWNVRRGFRRPGLEVRISTSSSFIRPDYQRRIAHIMPADHQTTVRHELLTACVPTPHLPLPASVAGGAGRATPDCYPRRFAGLLQPTSSFTTRWSVRKYWRLHGATHRCSRRQARRASLIAQEDICASLSDLRAAVSGYEAQGPATLRLWSRRCRVLALAAAGSPSRGTGITADSAVWQARAFQQRCAV